VPLDSRHQRLVELGPGNYGINGRYIEPWRSMGLANPQPLRSSFMGRQAILTQNVLAGIPALVAQGLRKADIAKRLGCKESTLQVRCCNAGISLRGGPKRLKLRDGVPLTLSRGTLASLGMRAAREGCSEAQLASDLLETIARDGLYDAVLDLAPPQRIDVPDRECPNAIRISLPV